MGATALSDPSVNKPVRSYFGDRVVKFYTLTMSNSYATGGDSVDFSADFDIGVDFLHVEDYNTDATHVYRAVYDRANGLIKVVNLIGGAEVANGVDLSGVAFRAMAVGK